MVNANSAAHRTPRKSSDDATTPNGHPPSRDEEREKEVARLTILIDTCEVSLTALIVRENEEHLERLKTITRDADEAEHNATMARTTILNAKAMAEAKHHRVDTVRNEIATLKQRLAKLQHDADELRAEKRGSPAGVDGNHAQKATVSHDATVAASDADVDDLENKVIALRQRHADVYGELRGLKMEVESLRANHQVLTQQRQTLLEQELRLLAVESNNCYDEARGLRKRHEELLKSLAASEQEIELATTEKQSMLRHLTEGALARCNALNDLRRGFQAKAAAHEQTFLTQLLADNKVAREDAFQIFLSSDQELDALRQYEGVLKQRVIESSQRLHTLAFRAELQHQKRQ